MPRDLPVIEDVTLQEMYANPYPLYERLRRDAPVARIAPANIVLVTKFDDIITIERDDETFPAFDPQSLQVKAMGHSLMRRDGAEHAAERGTLTKTFAPGTVKRHWGPMFEEIATRVLDEVRDKGRCDIYSDFASPVASECLAQIIGLTDTDWPTMMRWSLGLIEATGNYGNDPAIWARNEIEGQEINDAIDLRVEKLRGTDDPCVISAMINADPPVPIERVRANVKVTIGGGLNEPRDAICTTLLGLFQNPDQRSAVLEDEALFRTAFEEAVRWVAPIGMYPRRTSRDVVLSDILIPAGTMLGLSAASACHDEDHFANGGNFDIFRERASHLAFGSGPHFCLGTWSARKMVGEIAVPMLLRELPNLRLDPDHPHTMGGWVFRGPTSLPVVWDV